MSIDTGIDIQRNEVNASMDNYADYYLWFSLIQVPLLVWDVFQRSHTWKPS